jgi:hypothetical protein
VTSDDEDDDAGDQDDFVEPPYIHSFVSAQWCHTAKSFSFQHIIIYIHKQFILYYLDWFSVDFV